MLLTYPWPYFLLAVSVSDCSFGCYSNTNGNIIRVDELFFPAKWKLDQRAKGGHQSKTSDWVCIPKNKWKLLTSPGYNKGTDRAAHDSSTMIHRPPVVDEALMCVLRLLHWIWQSRNVSKFTNWTFYVKSSYWSSRNFQHWRCCSKKLENCLLNHYSALLVTSETFSKSCLNGFHLDIHKLVEIVKREKKLFKSQVFLNQALPSRPPEQNVSEAGLFGQIHSHTENEERPKV